MVDCFLWRPLLGTIGILICETLEAHVSRTTPEYCPGMRLCDSVIGGELLGRLPG